MTQYKNDRPCNNSDEASTNGVTNENNFIVKID